jgi:hypothetical protein
MMFAGIVKEDPLAAVNAAVKLVYKIWLGSDTLHL